MDMNMDMNMDMDGWISDLQPLAGIPGFGGYASCFGNRGSLSIVISRYSQRLDLAYDVNLFNRGCLKWSKDISLAQLRVFTMDMMVLSICHLGLKHRQSRLMSSLADEITIQ